MKKYLIIAILPLIFNLCLSNDKQIRLKGEIRENVSNKPLKAEIIITNIENDSLILESQSNKNGAYKINLDNDKIYNILIDKVGYKRYNFMVVGEKFSELGYMEYTKNIILEPIDEEFWFTLTILFGYDSTEIKSEYLNDVNKIADSLKKNESLLLELAVHSDDIGSSNFNDQLTLKRGETVKEFLKSLGVNENQILIIPYGKSLPKYPNKTPENRAKNRRCEFRIVAK